MVLSCVFSLSLSAIRSLKVLNLIWLAPIGIQNLKLYCNLQNVYTFTKYKGMDPEIGSANQDALLTGFDNYRYPSPRIYTFGLNLTF